MARIKKICVRLCSLFIFRLFCSSLMCLRGLFSLKTENLQNAFTFASILMSLIKIRLNNLTKLYFCVSLKFSGNPTLCGWRTNAQCGATQQCSSASSLLPCRSMSVSCPGKETLFPLSQVGNQIADCRLFLVGWFDCFATPGSWHVYILYASDFVGGGFDAALCLTELLTCVFCLLTVLDH